MTELTTLDRLKACRDIGCDVMFLHKDLDGLIAMFEGYEKAMTAERGFKEATKAAKTEARFLRGLIVVSAIILLGGFVGLWMAA